MSRSEWEKLERQTLKSYRQGLIHKARPMPTYKFFVPKPNLKPLTIPKSPSFIGKKRKQTLQRCTSADPFYLLPIASDLPSLEVSQFSPATDGGSFLDYSIQNENIQENANCTTNDETEEDMQ